MRLFSLTTGEQMVDHIKKADRPVPALSASLRSVVCVDHASCNSENESQSKLQDRFSSLNKHQTCYKEFKAEPVLQEYMGVCRCS